MVTGVSFHLHLFTNTQLNIYEKISPPPTKNMTKRCLKSNMFRKERKGFVSILVSSIELILKYLLLPLEIQHSELNGRLCNFHISTVISYALCSIKGQFGSLKINLHNLCVQNITLSILYTLYF